MAKFEQGIPVVTAGINADLSDSDFSRFVFGSLRRHLNCDWGVVCVEDKVTNDKALVEGDRLFSAYEYIDGRKIWVITECDRSVTTILYPSEY